MKRILLTGATGNMGSEVLKQLLWFPERFLVTVLVLPTAKDRAIMKQYADNPRLKIIWGDLINYKDVENAVSGMDYVLHVGGMVSPTADYYPELTMKVNVGSIENIINAIRAQSDPDAIKLVYIGTVAQTGSRNPPIHWGRVGDPIKISKYDNYAVSKTIAERKVIESGLKYWVSLRQTGILYPGLLNNLDPIMFHEPLGGVFEWVTAEDSGRALLHLCAYDLPDGFWRNVYNIGGGKAFRTLNLEFMDQTFKLLGVNDFRNVMDANWFALRNFHGQWYEDSDLLEQYLNFRSGSLDTFLKQLKSKIPFFTKLAGFLPSRLIKKFIFKPVARKPLGTLYWIENNIEEKIDAFFGSRKNLEQIKHWDDLIIPMPSLNPRRLNHGYDEGKPLLEINISDLKQAAAYRGGKCLSKKVPQGDLYQALKWQCAEAHEFDATPFLVLKTGHWCPHCFSAYHNYARKGGEYPFFAQVQDPPD